MKIAVVGFGLMGRQIAQIFAQFGNEVAATDDNAKALDDGINEILNGVYGIKNAVARGKLTEEDSARTIKAIKTYSSMKEACENADLVIEAVFENLSLKQEVIKQIDAVTPSKAIIASNTSTLGLSKISSSTEGKERVVGMHFFNPAQITKLVEIIKGDYTSESTVKEASNIAEKIGKTPIVALDQPGFVANKLGLSLYIEASRLFEEGIATIRDIDLAMKLGFNHQMGPFETADLVGLDTRLRNLEALFQQTNEERWIPPRTLRELVNQGFLGDPARRSGSKGGYYSSYERNASRSNDL